MRPIRKILLREQALTFGAVILVLAGLAWMGLSRALDHQIQARSEESLVRLGRDLRIYLQEGERIGDTVANFWESGVLRLGDPIKAQRLLYPLVEEAPSITGLLVATPDGQGLLLHRESGGITSRITTSAENGRLETRQLAEGWVSALPDAEFSIDQLRQRPWFQAAIKGNGPRWVGAYTFALAYTQGVSYVIPIRKATGELEAVVCVDLRLDVLSRRVWEARPTPGSLAMVCDGTRHALLVPLNAPTPGGPIGTEDFQKRIGPDFLPLFHQLLMDWERGGHPTAPIHLNRLTERYSGQVMRLQGLTGLDWYLCLAIPNRDYLSASYRLVLVLFLIGTAFLALIVWRIQRFAQRLGDPLDRLAQSALALGEGRMDGPVDTDLTEIRAVDEALRKAGQAIQNEAQMKMQLEHSQRLETVGTLAGGIAHDVNNQLASVLGQISLAEELLPREHPATYRIIRAQQAVERCSQMVRSLLSFSHQAKPLLRVMDLNELVTHTASLLERILGGLIRMELIESPCLPPILGERIQLEQVILNLAVNARDSMPKGGKLTIRTMPVGEDKVCLSVEDTGTGIPADILPRIFDPFFTTKEVGKGTGLGLAMVFSIVQAHGGRVEVDSQEGVGTRFRLFFDAHDVSEMDEEESHAHEHSNHSFEGLRILVAEDEPNLRELLTEAFEQRGAQVVAAPDGAVAWKKFQRTPFDLVVSDQRMPECTGLELLSRIRQSGSQVPMILASGFGLEGLDGELSRDPHLRFLTKPCMIHDFFRTAAELLAQRV